MTEYLEFPKMLVHADLPPAIAQTPDDERDLGSRGYAPAGRSDPEAYDRVMAGEIPGYEPLPYPKMVHDKIAHSPAEEAELVGAPVATPAAQKTEAEELAEFRAWKAAAPGKPAVTPVVRKTEAEELAEIEAAERAASKPKRTAKVS